MSATSNQNKNTEVAGENLPASSSTHDGNTDEERQSKLFSPSSSLGSLAWLNRLVPTMNELASQGEPSKRRMVDEGDIYETNWATNQHTRPPFAYSFLIYEAMKALNKDKVTLMEVYVEIANKYAYYRARNTETGWKNSIRHNLTVHDCFVKVNRNKDKGENGKGGFWTVDEALAQEEVDFGTRGSERQERQKKKRKLAKAKKADKQAADDHDVVKTPTENVVAVTPTPILSTVEVPKPTLVSGSAEDKRPLIDVSEALGDSKNNFLFGSVGDLMKDTYMANTNERSSIEFGVEDYDEDAMLTNLKHELEKGVPTTDLDITTNGLGNTAGLSGMYNGFAGSMNASFTNLAGSFTDIAGSISAMFKKW
eukprot:m.187411 g.187411  ORF g.187411 m.187411 type:complete len:367 (-) comp32305_c0_seq1:567-1667(-)